MNERTERSPLAMPREGELVLDFVNSNAGGQAEQFADGDGLMRWAAAHDFELSEVTENDVDNARALRDALQVLLLQHSSSSEQHSADTEQAELYLREAAQSHVLVAEITADGAALSSPERGLAGLLGTLLARVTELSLSGAWPRFKACQNPICHESFFDRSRNSSARYHTANCTAMVAMRKYRGKK